MHTFINNVKIFFTSVFSKSKKIVNLPHAEDEYDSWLGV